MAPQHIPDTINSSQVTYDVAIGLVEQAVIDIAACPSKSLKMEGFDYTVYDEEGNQLYKGPFLSQAIPIYNSLD